MDTQRVVLDSVEAEKANAMRRYRWRQNLRWLWKACLPLATLSYALCRDAPRQLLVAVFNSNLCVFLLLNALVIVTCVLSGKKLSGGEKVAENYIYGEYVAKVESTRRSYLAAGIKGTELVTTEAEEYLVKGKEMEGFVSSRSMVAEYESPAKTVTTPVPVEVSNFKGVVSYENVETLLPVCEDKAVTESKTVASSVSAVTTKNSGGGEGSEKVKSYRRTQSESFEKIKEGKRRLQRSETEMHRKTEPERRSSVEDLSDEEFQRQVELFITSKKMFQMLEDRKV